MSRSWLTRKGGPSLSPHSAGVRLCPRTPFPRLCLPEVKHLEAASGEGGGAGPRQKPASCERAGEREEESWQQVIQRSPRRGGYH